MCGRGALEQKLRKEQEEWLQEQSRALQRTGISEEWADLAASIGADEVVMEGPRARYNIAPTDWIPTFIESKTLIDSRWGIERGKGKMAFNAKAESILDQRWADVEEQGRVVHVLSGYYEWRSGNRDDPVYITRQDGAPTFLAALMDERTGTARSTTVTIAAPAGMASIHDRVPLILSSGELNDWWSGSYGLEQATEASASHFESLEIRPVQTLVNKSTNEGPALILPRPTLF